MSASNNDKEPDYYFIAEAALKEAPEILSKHTAANFAVQYVFREYVNPLKAELEALRKAQKGGGRASRKAKSTPAGDGKPDYTLYNMCMGVFRRFLSGRNTHLDMAGRKANDNKQAMLGIIGFMRDFMRSNGMPNEDADVLKAVEFLFTQENWNRLNDFHRNRIKLPDIYKNIEEILPMIRNGASKKSAANDELEQLKHRITSGQ